MYIASHPRVRIEQFKADGSQISTLFVRMLHFCTAAWDYRHACRIHTFVGIQSVHVLKPTSHGLDRKRELEKRKHFFHFFLVVHFDPLTFTEFPVRAHVPVPCAYILSRGTFCTFGRSLHAVGYCAVARQRVNSKFTAVHLMVLSFRSADGGELTRGVASSLSSTFFACV